MNREKKTLLTKRAPKSRRLTKKLLSFAGVWSDLDIDRFIEELYKARYEAPPSGAPKV